MQEKSWTELKAMKLADIVKGPCLKVTGDGKVAFYLIVEPQGAMIARIEGNCSLIDASKGFS